MFVNVYNVNIVVYNFIYSFDEIKGSDNASYNRHLDMTFPAQHGQVQVCQVKGLRRSFKQIGKGSIKIRSFISLLWKPKHPSPFIANAQEFKWVKRNRVDKEKRECFISNQVTFLLFLRSKECQASLKNPEILMVWFPFKTFRNRLLPISLITLRNLLDNFTRLSGPSSDLWYRLNNHY